MSQTQTLNLNSNPEPEPKNLGIRIEQEKHIGNSNVREATLYFEKNDVKVRIKAMFERDLVAKKFIASIERIGFNIDKIRNIKIVDRGVESDIIVEVVHFDKDANKEKRVLALEFTLFEVDNNIRVCDSDINDLDSFEKAVDFVEGRIKAVLRKLAEKF